MSEEHLRNGVAASTLVIKNIDQEQVNTIVDTLNLVLDFFEPEGIRLHPTARAQDNGLWEVKMRCWK